MDAERPLVDGYEGLFRIQETIPADNKVLLVQGKNAILKLYQDWGRTEELVAWQKKLEDQGGPR